MPENLVQHRSGSSVWDRVGASAPWDTERWLAGVLAGGFLVAGLRRRSVAGLLMVAGGGALACWAASGIGTRNYRRGKLVAVWPTQWHSDDKVIGDASEASFPASDAPAWTQTTGNTAGPTKTPGKVPTTWN